MKIANSVLLSLFMSSNGMCNIGHAPSTGFSGTLVTEILKRGNLLVMIT